MYFGLSIGLKYDCKRNIDWQEPDLKKINLIHEGNNFDQLHRMLWSDVNAKWIDLLNTFVYINFVCV